MASLRAHGEEAVGVEEHRRIGLCKRDVGARGATECEEVPMLVMSVVWAAAGTGVWRAGELVGWRIAGTRRRRGGESRRRG